MNTTLSRSKIILWSLCGYFFLCGSSALVYPESWLLLSGLPSTVNREMGLVFGTLGSFLLALCYGAGRAAISPSANVGVVAILLVANLLDFLVTLRAMITQSLPFISGALFLIVTIVWVTLLVPVYLRALRSSTPHES
jgi:hypothetical protein